MWSTNPNVTLDSVCAIVVGTFQLKAHLDYFGVCVQTRRFRVFDIVCFFLIVNSPPMSAPTYPRALCVRPINHLCVHRRRNNALAPASSINAPDALWAAMMFYNTCVPF